MLEMVRDDLVNVIAIDVGVPNSFWINDDTGSLRTAVEATRTVDPDPARTGETEFLDSPLGIVAHGLRIVVSAAGLAAFALVNTEKDVIPVVGHAVLQVNGQ